MNAKHAPVLFAKGDAMDCLQENAVLKIAGNTRRMLEATDQTLLAHAHMFVSVLEGAGTSSLPIGVTQDVYRRLVAHGGRLVEGREELSQLIARMTVIKDGSDQRELATGCPGGFPNALIRGRHAEEERA